MEQLSPRATTAGPECCGACVPGASATREVTTTECNPSSPQLEEAQAQQQKTQSNQKKTRIRRKAFNKIQHPFLIKKKKKQNLLANG